MRAFAAAAAAAAAAAPLLPFCSLYRPAAVLQAVKDGPAWAVDAWGLGCLMQEVYSGAPLARTEDLRNTGGCCRDRLLGATGISWRALKTCATQVGAAGTGCVHCIAGRLGFVQPPAHGVRPACLLCDSWRMPSRIALPTGP